MNRHDMRNKLLIAGALCVFAANVSADSGFSIDILAGNAYQKTEIQDLSFSGSSLSLGVRTAYAFNDYLAAELSYIHYGEVKGSYHFDGDEYKENIESSSINLGLKGSFPIQNGFSAVGRLGVSRWDYNVKETYSFSPGETLKFGDEGIDLYYGLGAEYRASNSMRIALEYTYLSMGAELNNVDFDHTVGNLALSLGYTF
ncbi:hypothetical protein EZI54_22645 [Marinobacter halodurans]|uniref:Outer membrane protein OmpA-like transmembrane domain-containing protein n=2 Tax=Marinobacter halodurans TaxID=2528979 RepID=A0ABY1ZFS8_9GAMM|nr:hypothetical protein EZI54_22645 [Marinobacter halodurans]